MSIESGYFTCETNNGGQLHVFESASSGIEAKQRRTGGTEERGFMRIEKGNANELKTMWIKEEEDQILKKIREKKQRFSEIINKSCMYIVCIHTLFLT